MIQLRARAADGATLDHLVYANRPGEPFRYYPDRFILEATMPSLSVAGTSAQVVLKVPQGWYVLDYGPPLFQGQRRWWIWPSGQPPSALYAELTVTLRVQRRAIARGRLGLPIWIMGYHRFVPEQHRLPWANTLADLGEIEPSHQQFTQTFRFCLFPRAFFRGLYRDTVGIRQRGAQVIGGLCTGLSRLALARALEASPLPEGTLLEQVIVLHGRQLTDRALLAGAPWFFFPSPRRAYFRFMQDVLQRRESDLCFDINVPVPWRRDVIQALLGQGHTVVPYAFQQQRPDHAAVWVFDPNAPDRASETVLSIDLRRNRYAYPPLITPNDRVTIVAVRLPHYLRGRTAVLASLANMVLYGPRWPLVMFTGSVLALTAYVWRHRATAR